MKLFDSELQYLSELYQRLGKELAESEPAAEMGPATLIRSILQSRELQLRVEQMNPRISQLAGEWEKFRGHLDPKSRAKTQRVAEGVQGQAHQLANTIRQRIIDLERFRSQLEARMTVMSKGARYLESVQPIKANYPKFIDSLG